MSRLLPLLAGLALLLAPGLVALSAADDAKPYVTARDVDLTLFLKPPPANDSDETRRELAEVLSIQVTRTPAMEAAARADAEETVWRFADVLGPAFKPEALPGTEALFARLNATEGAVVDPAKDVWKRPRPHLYSALVHPAVPLSKSGAYPSGHATNGTLMGIVLATMLPERRAAIMARAWAYGENRIVGGIHFRSDVEAGRIAGSLIAEAVMAQPDFQAAYGPARAELRTALGLN